MGWIDRIFNAWFKCFETALRLIAEPCPVWMKKKSCPCVFTLTDRPHSLKKIIEKNEKKMLKSINFFVLS